MTQEQILIITIMVATVALFFWGRWRHDFVAIASLLACVLAGLVPSGDAFAGFGHPAVITVACVLVLSAGLQSTGAVDVLARHTIPENSGPTITIAAITAVGAVLSAFMNNVGAMALLMPLGIQIASRHGLPPGKVLMPLAFGTILGGMTTLIGTPPNLIVSGFREETGQASFGMFDFTPVGLTVAAAGVLFVALIGWRIVPSREQKGAAGFDTGKYLTEARITEDSQAVGKSLRAFEQDLEAADAQIIGMVRNEFRVFAPNPYRLLRGGDVLVIEAEPEALTTVLSGLGLVLESQNKLGDVPADGDQSSDEDSAVLIAENGPDALPSPANSSEPQATVTAKDLGQEENELQEVVLRPTSALIGRTAKGINIRARFGLNLLAISHGGRRTINRLRSTAFQAGDVLLLQGPADALSGFTAEYDCIPLAHRDIRLPDKKKAITASLIMVLAIAGAAFGLLPAAISFACGALAFMVLRIIPARMAYSNIDWPVVVLLGALIPVAGAMSTTGTADLVARLLLENVVQGKPVIALAVILVITMTLSDFMNNAATAAVMCPIGLSTATQLGVNPDAFLMAVAVGASCAFLTPVGHQNNTLILGPGGFRFGDYWKLGLPMEILVVGISIPMLLLVWPL